MLTVLGGSYTHGIMDNGVSSFTTRKSMTERDSVGVTPCSHSLYLTAGSFRPAILCGKLCIYSSRQPALVWTLKLVVGTTWSSYSKLSVCLNFFEIRETSSGAPTNWRRLFAKTYPCKEWVLKSTALPQIFTANRHTEFAVQRTVQIWRNLSDGGEASYRYRSFNDWHPSQRSRCLFELRFSELPFER
jgi:hypothetical protein